MSHKPAKPIQQQIQDLINVRKARLQKEIQEFEQKKYEAEYVYGVNGGSANRCEKAIKVREDELEQLDALSKSYGAPVSTTIKITRYRYRCTCGSIVETRQPVSREYIDCPFCRGCVSRLTEGKVEREVILPPKPHYIDSMEEWRKLHE